MDLSHPYSALTPDCALDALDSTGLKADGRLLALNSYENRVYQMGVEDAAPVVVKFYRPERWSDAAILEEHAYTIELAAREIPVVAPLALNDATLNTHAGFRFAVYPKQGGRMPEFDRTDTLQWMGRFLGRIHAVGALSEFCRTARCSNIETFGSASRDFLRAGNWLPPDLVAAWNSVVDHALTSVAHCYDRAGKRARDPPARRLPCRQRVVDRDPGRTSSISTTAAWGRRYRICGCCCRASATSSRRSSTRS